MKLNKWLFLLSSMGIACLIGLYYLALQQEMTVPEDYQTYIVKKGASASSVANELAQKKIILSPYLVKAYLKLNPKAASIKAGEYALPEVVTLPQLMKILTEGKSIQYAFTIIEGWNYREMLAEIRKNEYLQHTLPTENAADALMAAMGEPDIHPEGAFLPETYYFSKGTTDIAFLKRARLALKEALAAAWENRADDIQVKSPYEALILASIVEKETAAVHERPLISGVFTNRLRIGMKLQTDPTVIYGIGPSYDGDIRFRDLRTDTPYNTYTRYGLPPTPIAMAGKEAIDAALHPEETKALYFVSRNDGTHIFSETLQAHEAAVDKYQRGK